MLALLTSTTPAIDNGKGATPPMGWRSWNLYGHDVDQKLIEGIMDGMVKKRPLPDGSGTSKSLCDLGYCDVGLDDNWQQCGSHGAGKYTYHTDSGLPIVNPDRFPDFIHMTSHAHSLGLTAGWYLNNCICKDHCGNAKDHGETDPKCYQGDVAALIEFGFDSVKLDGCGAQRDLDLWANLMNASGRAIMIENCHWGGTTPNATWCPWNFFRTSGDVRASYAAQFDAIRRNSAQIRGAILAQLSDALRPPQVRLGRLQPADDGAVGAEEPVAPRLLGVPRHARGRLPARPRRRARPRPHRRRDALALRRVGDRVEPAHALARREQRDDHRGDLAGDRERGGDPRQPGVGGALGLAVQGGRRPRPAPLARAARRPLARRRRADRGARA